MVRACELCATTAGVHALAVLPIHSLNTCRAVAVQAEVQVAHEGSNYIYLIFTSHFNNFERVVTCLDGMELSEGSHWSKNTP